MSSVSRFALQAEPQWPDEAEEADGLWELAYYSEAAGPLDPSCLESLLRAARRRNEAAGLTGLLLYWDQSFFQILEGAVADLRAIYAGFIVPASSHRQIFVCHLGPIRQRAFPDWSMAARIVGRQSEIVDIRAAIHEISTRRSPEGRSAGRIFLDAFAANLRTT